MVQFTHREMISPWDHRSVRVSMICEGPAGAIEYWFALFGPELAKVMRPYSCSGVECHSKRPLAAPEPSQECCHILGGPCWHDGSSLMSDEIMTPALFNGGPALVRQKLEETYRNWFEREVA